MKNHIQKQQTQCPHLPWKNTYSPRKSTYNSKGQLLLEVLWLILFSCAFLAMLSHLYEKGKKEIQLSRIGEKHFYRNK